MIRARTVLDRCWIKTASGFLLGLFSLASAASDTIAPVDYQAPPEAVRLVESPRGGYRLLIETEDRRARATLVERDNPEVFLWRRNLPQEWGPRVALLGCNGSVLFLDEWINVFTDYAIMVIDIGGDTVVELSTDDVATFLGISRAEIAGQATLGPWMRGSPGLTDEGDAVIVPMGEVSLLVSLSDGSLSLAP